MQLGCRLVEGTSGLSAYAGHSKLLDIRSEPLLANRLGHAEAVTWAVPRLPITKHLSPCPLHFAKLKAIAVDHVTRPNKTTNVD